MGAKVLNETLLRKGAKLAKVREESPRVTLKYQQKEVHEVGGPVKGPPAVGLPTACREDADKIGSQKWRGVQSGAPPNRPLAVLQPRVRVEDAAIGELKKTEGPNRVNQSAFGR